MPPISRAGDITNTGHLCNPPLQQTLMDWPKSNPTVFAQGSLIVRQMDPTVIHPIEVSVNPLVCAPHIGVVMKGCITVLVTGMPVARIGDPVDFGNLTTGAMTVHAGVG